MASPLLAEEPSYNYNNQFFHPVVCHVCKRLNNGNTINCDCHMISYCSRQHMMTDWERTDENIGHREFCEVVKKLSYERRIGNFTGETTDEWRRYRKQSVTIVERKLGRNLLPCERRMLLLARSCFVCYKSTNLRPCPNCFTIDYCDEHRDHRIPHKCEALKEWLSFEIKAVNAHPVPRWRTFHSFPTKCYVDDIDSFYEEYVLSKRNGPWNITDAVQSDYFSGPLTVYHGMRDANLLEISNTEVTFVIHVIGANHMDQTNLPSWEIFLHVFTERTRLIVIMIGLELAPRLDGKCGKLPICWKKCGHLEHELRFEYHRTTYHDYANSDLYMEPDVIVGFQVNFGGEESWEQFLSSLQTPSCPLILTTASRADARKVIKKIQESQGEGAKPTVNRMNRFWASRPHRDYETGRIFQRNQHLIIYENPSAHRNVSQV